MNAKAAELGMKDSHFVTPSGLDQEGHASSAYDMALLAAAALRNPLLAEICAKKSAVIAFGNPKRKVTVTNHNKLLSLYPDAGGNENGFYEKIRPLSGVGGPEGRRYLDRRHPEQP